MPAAINLQKVIISGWKAIDENPVEIQFDGESWLIYGGNETGKSSTFSAIRTALFERPDAKGAFANDWVNNQTPNGARIELELLVNGQGYTIVKTRGTNGNGNTTLYDGCGVGRMQVSTGTDAVNQILGLIGAKPRGGAGGRNPEQPQNWGILAWLLAPQGMDSVTPAREQGTQTIGLERAVSAQMVQVEEDLKGNLSNELTDTGKPKAGGTLKAAIAAVANATETLDEVKVKRGEYTQLLQQITQVEESIETEVTKLAEAEEAINELVGNEVDLTGMDTQIATIQGRIDLKEQEVVVARENVIELENIENEANTLQKELDKLKDEIKTVHSHKKDLEVKIKSNLQQINLLNERLQDNSADNISKQEILAAALVETRRIELNERLEKLEDLESQKNELLKQGSIIEDNELNNMHELVLRFEKADAMLKALTEGTGVSVHVDGDLEANWNIDGLETDVESRAAFAQEMSIQGTNFTLNLKKETRDDIDWVEERNECISEFEKYSVLDSAGLRNKLEVERNRSKSLESLKEKIEDLPTRNEIQEGLDKLPKKSEQNDDLDVDLLKNEIEALKSEKEDLDRDIGELRDSTEPLEQECASIVDDLAELRAKENATDALAKNAYSRRDTEIEQNGVIATRKQREKELKKELTKMEKERERLIIQKETEEKAAKGGIIQARRVKNHIERELIRKRSDLGTLNDKAEELGGENLQQAFVEANIAMNATSQNKVRIERVVEAERRLLERFTRALDDATELEIGPIKDQVQIWLAAVTQGKWTQLEMDSKLNVTRISGPSSPPIEGEKVGSGGLKQVIHALIRLAVACKIHDDNVADDTIFPPVALVMDESQGHVDDDRVRRLVGRFNAEIERGRVQVIALSHRRNEFQSLSARNYNVERRESTDDRYLEE